MSVYAAGLFGASLAERMTQIEPAVRFYKYRYLVSYTQSICMCITIDCMTEIEPAVRFLYIEHPAVY